MQSLAPCVSEISDCLKNRVGDEIPFILLDGGLTDREAVWIVAKVCQVAGIRFEEFADSINPDYFELWRDRDFVLNAQHPRDVLACIDSKSDRLTKCALTILFADWTDRKAVHFLVAEIEEQLFLDSAGGVIHR